MAFFGKVTRINEVIRSDKLSKLVSDYIISIESGNFNAALGRVNKVTLDNDVFAIEQVYMTKSDEDCVYEAHRKYIDIHYILSGTELHRVAFIEDCAVQKEYEPDSDYALYACSRTPSEIVMGQGCAALYAPHDVHMTSIALGHTTELKKTVIKIPLMLF